MRTLMLLKFMIDLFFYGVVLMIIVSFCYAVISGSYTIGGQALDHLNATKIALIITTILKLFFFVFSIYHVKRLATYFIRSQLFTEMTCGSLRRIGIGFVLYAVSESIAEMLYAYVNGVGDTILSLNFQGFNSAWFQITLGLLFIFMELVFRNAELLKKENDLTI